MPQTYQNLFLNHLTQHETVIALLKSDVLLNSLQRIAQCIFDAVQNGHPLYIMGNGGSAADSQHLAAELINRFRLERRALPAFALTTDSSILTSIANDSAFDQVFARQIEALAKPHDVVMAITTSDAGQNHSLNLQNGLIQAKKNQATTILLGSQKTKKLVEYADHSLLVPSSDTPRIQEVHVLIEHVMCDYIDSSLEAASA